jgi:siroheme synthase-like protein
VPYFPLFINLKGRFCLVAGGGAVAARKVQALLDFDAILTVVDPAPSENIRSLEQAGRIRVRKRPYGGPAEMAGAALVIAATGDRELNRRIAGDADALGIPVNVGDAPDLCSFYFPALVRRGDLVAGISTSGACPRLATRLRQQLDACWPPGLGEALEELKEARRRLRESSDPAETLRRLDALITGLLEEFRGTGESTAGLDRRPSISQIPPAKPGA